MRNFVKGLSKSKDANVYLLSIINSLGKVIDSNGHWSARWDLSPNWFSRLKYVITIGDYK